MKRIFPVLIVALSVARTPLASAQSSQSQSASTCFSGPIRPACSGFVLFEGSASVAGGEADHVSTTISPVPPGQGEPITLVNRFRDLPSYYSGSLGYLKVTGPRSAVGAVAELGFSNTSALGNAHRVAVTARMRKQLAAAALDFGAGPLGVQVFIPANGTCCTDRTNAYGATAEAALLWHGYLGVTAGADLVHGGNRTSGAAHIGVRVGSYGAVATAVVTAALGALTFYALSHSSD